jgi:hypothetical protein
MRTLGKWLLVFGIFALCGGTARPADPEKVIAEEGAVRLVLLRQKAVQDELKLDKAQVDKIESFSDEQWKKAQDIHKQGGEQEKAKFEELHKANTKFIEATLKPEQEKRLDQIAMHVAGLLWVTDPKVENALKLTDDQKTKIKELHKAAHKDTEAIHIEDAAAREAKLKELRAAHRKELYAILTDDQKTKWKELAGEPFKGELHFVSPDAKK